MPKVIRKKMRTSDGYMPMKSKGGMTIEDAEKIMKPIMDTSMYGGPEKLEKTNPKGFILKTKKGEAVFTPGNEIQKRTFYPKKELKRNEIKSI